MLRQTQFVRPVPLLIATHLGLINDLDGELELTQTRGSEEQLSQLRSGAQDLAATAIDNLFVWNRRGLDARVIAQIEHTTPLTLFARADIPDVRSLEGARFAVDAVDNGFSLAARRVLAEEHITVQFVEVGGVRERFDALVKGTADAALLGPPFDEFAAHAGLIPVASIPDLIPGYPGQGLIADATVLADRRDEIVQYIGVLAAATQHANEMTDADGVAVLTAAGFPDAAAQTAWHARPRSLKVSIPGLQVVERVRKDLGALPEGYRGVAELVDESFVSSDGSAR